MRRYRVAWVLLAAICIAAAHDAVAAGPSDELPRKGQLGVRVLPVPDDVRAREKLRAGEGLVVDDVVPETTASRGGLRRGDVLLTIDGRAVEDVAGFLIAVTKMKVGQRFVLGIARDGQRLATPLTLEERPRDRGASFDVLYTHVRSKGSRIRTIVTRPHAPGPHPALLLIQGLGASTIDEPLSSPSAYSRILSAFAEAGYVTMRVEKPGIGDSEGGPYAEMDFLAELDIYRQALLALGATDGVDRDNLFVFGHSIGGVFAPLLAAETRVRGVAVYGTVVKRWTEYVLENTLRQAALGGSNPTAIENTARALNIVLKDLFVEGKSAAEVVRRRPHLRAVVERFFPDGRLYGRSLRFWSQLQQTDLAAVWAKSTGAVLAMWGRGDFIATEADHPKIAAIVDKARPGTGTYLAIDGADHTFRQATSPDDSFRRWNTAGGEINVAAITALKTWTEQTRRAR